MINFSIVLVLLDFLIHINTYGIIHYKYLRGHGLEFQVMYLSILDPEGMPNSKAFHLGLH